MKNKPLIAISGALLALYVGFCLPVLLSSAGCTSLSPSQLVAANGEAAGELIGTRLLNKHLVNGVVDPVYLASYEAMVPKIAKVMDGAITPADVHAILAGADGVQLTTPQSNIIAYLDGLSPTFIKANANPLTPDGALVTAAAQQVASGLARAVGLVTGTNFTPSPPQ